MNKQMRLIQMAIDARKDLLDRDEHDALRLFNGFLEGDPSLVVDLYGRTAVVQDYATPEGTRKAWIADLRKVLLAAIPRIRTMVVKVRKSSSRSSRNGVLVYGTEMDRWIREHDVRYALDLTMHQDSSYYLDMRHLRHWIIGHLTGKTVLNLFAYTGSLGAAALAGGARRVVHLDRKREFLNVAKTTYSLNGFPIDKQDFRTEDFFVGVGRLKRAGVLFDCVILDPPFFSETAKGRVDLSDSRRLINKVRPLVADHGILIAVNNALFVSGKDYMATLNALCEDGYLAVEDRIPVPEDVTGFPETCHGDPVSDPDPFNHATKIAIIRVKRKP